MFCQVYSRRIDIPDCTFWGPGFLNWRLEVVVKVFHYFFELLFLEFLVFENPIPALFIFFICVRV